MARVTKQDGEILIYNFYYKAIFYKIGKWGAEKFDKLEFGPEIPLKFLRN